MPWHLTRGPDLDAEVEAVARRHGGRCGVEPVLAHPPRRLRRTLAPGLRVRAAWTWEAADRRDPEWWPQGVAASPDGRHLAVSWYAKRGGSRLSNLDVAARRYVHVPLLVPTADGDTAPLRIHAGGLAWEDRWIHVAATGRGFWSAHLDDVVRTPDGYLLPVRRPWRASADGDDEPLRYSFLGLDRAAATPTVVVGEYGPAPASHRLFRVDLTAATQVLQPVDHGVVRAQGGARLPDGRQVLATSNGPWRPGSLWTGAPGRLREQRWALPMGPEDLDTDPVTGDLWGVTEHPRRRWIVRVRRP
jgi:hypothetical protein